MREREGERCYGYGSMGADVEIKPGRADRRRREATAANLEFMASSRENSAQNLGEVKREDAYTKDRKTTDRQIEERRRRRRRRRRL